MSNLSIQRLAGYHHIVIKDNQSLPPVSTPQAGSYTEKQNVELLLKVKIYYSTDNGQNYTEYISPIEIEVTTTIKCYTKREMMLESYSQLHI